MSLFDYLTYQWTKGQRNWHIPFNDALKAFESFLGDKGSNSSLSAGISTYESEITAAADGETSLLAKHQAQDALFDTEHNPDGTHQASSSVDADWIASAHSVTFISANSFSFPADVAPLYVENRRIKAILSGGDVYATVASASYSAPNTIVTTNESVLDNTLSSISYGILSPGEMGSMPINPQAEVNTSNLMRAFEELQENHGGSLYMEKGWSDSFGNANEQGADEANSTGFQHDPSNTLYKGTDPGTNDSDKDYTTEANYLQQEWTNANQGTAKATVVNGDATVNLASGFWPTNCSNAKISFDSGSTWYDINSRTDGSNIELTTLATEASNDYDYIIRMSAFNSGVVKLSSNGDFPVGDGRDGTVTITASKNINTNILGSLRSTNADGISTTVTANPTGTSIPVGSITGFADGDKILLINMQGTTGDLADVGNYEILTVSGTPSGSTVATKETITKSYDGVSFASQKVVCQRIPQWTDVNINSGGDLTCNAWNGSSGGVLIFYASGTVTVTSGRTIHADSKGYRGGAKSVTNGASSYQGESILGTGSTGSSANEGGGGGSYASTSQNGDGGGGGHGTVGANGQDGNQKGTGGSDYGDVKLADLFLGSGGGGGAYHWHGGPGASDGAIGGGIIYIIATTVVVDGKINSKGGISGTATGNQGGGGAGGAIFIRTESLTLGTDSISAIGGHANDDVNDGKGGEGRIRFEYQTINAKSFPSDSDANTGSDPDPGSTAEARFNVFSECVSVCDSETKKTDTSGWTDINSGSVMETRNDQDANYWVCFDPAVNFGANTEIKIFNQDGSVWRTIAKNNSNTWEYNNAVYDSTKVLLHGDGSDGSTTFTDSGPLAHAFTVFGNAQIDTAQSKFGGASMLFDGTGDYIQMTSEHSDLDLGDSDWTIDYWVRFNSASQSGKSIWTIGDASDNLYLQLESNPVQYFYVYYTHPTYTNFATTNFNRGSGVSTGQWYHHAFVKKGTDLYMFEDGKQIATAFSPVPPNMGSFTNSKLSLGRREVYSDGYFDGWIEEFRFSKTALWTENFTPPTSPHIYISGGPSDYAGVTADTNDMLHAASQAVSAQEANRMDGTDLANITDSEWEDSYGWSTSTDSMVRGVTLYSSNEIENPNVSQYQINHDSVRGELDLISQIYDPGFAPSEVYLWARAEYSDIDGPGTFQVSRNGGSEWATITMEQKGLPITGDIRILRGTVDLSGQTSGQDLRCRYQTGASKDQFLHSWGLQAKS